MRSTSGRLSWGCFVLFCAAFASGCDGDGQGAGGARPTASSSSGNAGDGGMGGNAIGGMGGQGSSAVGGMGGQGGAGGQVIDCGNGIIEASEGCDDGNQTSGDGCGTNCAIEPGYLCSGMPSQCYPCGNGILDPGEQCDDRNDLSIDGCFTCRVEIGYSCSGAPSACVSGCGDGFLGLTEICDDGNNVNGDGCSDVCEIENGFTCGGAPTICTTSCGDGIVAGAEACDDSNANGNDGCDAQCQAESGFSCAGMPSVCTPGCGDGTIAGTEVCDDGNIVGGDGCGSSCKVEPGYACNGAPSACAPSCGDGIVTGTETCDDGNTIAGDCCDSVCAAEDGCEIESNDTTNLARAFDTLAKANRVKGNVNPLSDVDIYAITVPPNSYGTLIANISDGFMTPCNSQLIDSRLRVYNQQGQMLEENDDRADDLCSELTQPGLLPGSYYIEVSAAPKNGSPPFDYALNLELQLDTCGDGKIAATAFETCDDGNVTPGDGCSASCTIEMGFACAGMPSVCASGCGNGILGGPELCDDGNLVAGDGCSDVCVVESGFTCTGMPSGCQTTCGDGIVSGGETCDDGNTTNGDCCTASCVVEAACEIEPNSDIAHANDFAALASMNHLRGLIRPAQDVDYYKFTVPLGARGTVVAETQDGTTSTCAGLDLDSNLNLYDEAGTLVATDDDGAPIGYCSRLSANWLEPGNHYLEVRASPLQASLEFDYVLAVQLDVSICGDGQVGAAEQCDDGMLMNGDGCSSICELELPTELESNNTPQEANGLAPGFPATIRGAIQPKTDTDFYAFTLTQTSDVRIDTTDKFGPGSCKDIDTTLALYGPDMTTLLAFDDQGGVNGCARIDPFFINGAEHLAPGTYYVRVKSYGDTMTIPAYNLIVEIVASCGDGQVEGSEECDPPVPNVCDPSCQNVPVCGDGQVDGNETCDDANVASNDGCSSTCQFEGPDVEPNNTFAQADQRASGQPSVLISGDVDLLGSIAGIGDVDTYKMSLPNSAMIRFETFDNASGEDCSDPTTTAIRLFDAQGQEIGFDGQSGIGNCSAFVTPLNGGTYYVRVEDFANDGIVAGYRLQVRVIPTGGNESEPNDTRTMPDLLAGPEVYVTGGHQNVGDIDYFQINVPSGKSVRAEIIEGGSKTCESNDIDSYVELYNANGVKLAEDDDEGRGYCSLIDGTGATLAASPGAHGLPAGTYYLAVMASPGVMGSAGSFDYRLVITIR